MSRGKHRLVTSKHRASTSFWRRRIGSVSLIAVLIVGGATIAFATHGPDYINLADANATIFHDGAVFRQGPLSAGTGQFNPFLTLRSSADTERGHNTSSAGTGLFTTYDAAFAGNGRTKALKVAAIPETLFQGSLYREFVLDANETGSDKCMSVDDIRIFRDSQSDLKGFSPSLETFHNDDATKAVKIFDLDIPILMSSQRTGAASCGGTGIGESGSGNADITVLIPNDAFPTDCNYGNAACDQWLYFWTEKGGFDASSFPQFQAYNWNVSAGFEEWNTRLLPVVHVTKTANPSYTVTYPWTIEKLVAKGAGVTDDAAFADAQTLDMFTGDSEDVTWKVTVTKGTGVTSDAKVAGVVTVKNPTGPGQVIPVAIPATINSVTDALSLGGITTNAPVTCPVTFPYELAAGATLTCTYDQPVANPVDGTNTATVNINIAGGTKNYTGSAAVSFTNPTEVDGAVDVSDTNGKSWLDVGGSESWTYKDTFSCDDDEGQNNNLATFNSTTTAATGSDDADVFVNCYQPDVSKTVTGTYAIGNSWSITKVGDRGYHLFAGDDVVHDYDIDVTLTQTDGPGKVSGTVKVTNPNPEDDLVVPVVDKLSDNTPVTLECGSDVPVDGNYTIAASGSLNCTYTDIEDANRDAISNTVTVTLNGDDYTATELFTYSTTDEGIQTVGVLDENDQDGVANYGPFTDTDSIDTSSTYECSTDVDDYLADGTYTYTVDNTATLTDGGVKFGTPATASVKVTCYIPVVTKTADGTSDEVHEWEIVKEFDGEYHLFAGQTITHEYEIDLTETVTDENFEVTGEIEITNPHPTENITVTVADVLSDTTDATIDSCTGGTLTGDSLEIAADTTATCEYTATPTDNDADENTATVTTENDVEVSATVDINWTSSLVGYDEVNVTDDYATDADATDDLTWETSVDGISFDYERDFTCPTDLTMYANGVYETTFVNTATIDETGADDDATVTLNCYALGVTKTADTTFTRTYDWKIVKDAVDTNGASIGAEGLMLAFGQSYLLDWKVTVSQADTPYVDSDHSVDGVITIKNPSPNVATVDVTDEFTPTGGLGVALAVDCDAIVDGGQSTSVQVPAAVAGVPGEVTCTYGYATDEDGENEATATLVQAPQTAFSGAAAVLFGAPTSLVNDSVIVTDEFNGGAEGQLGVVTVAQAPKTFTVSTLLSSDASHVPDALLECGDNLIVNLATVYVNEDGSLGVELDTANRQVPVYVACDLGCTLTQGYWKTHNQSFWGGAPADDTWLLIGDADGDGTVEGAGELFYGTDKTWFDVMWTAPKGGNAYYQLAHQWIAAKLNVLNGAATTGSVDAALAYGENFFANNLPDGNFKGKAGKDIRAYASTLAAYNEGDIGPGHCDEDGMSIAIAPLLIGAYFWQRHRGRHRATR